VMHVETDPHEPEAEKLMKQVTVGGAAAPDGSVLIQSSVPWSEFRGRLWVRFDVTTPRNYNVDVLTRAGNIVMADIDGRVSLTSFGGNVEAGNVAGAARLETRGGHLKIGNVGGELIASTAGGHITAGNIAGAATLRTGGGHIRVASIQGVGSAETGGGDIAISKTGAKFTAVSQGGGQITFGEASGAVEARTAGGGIRVLNVAGPMQLNSAGGSIYLTQIRDAVHASTASGNITAWFVGEGRKGAPSQLQCSEGDIIVYLPRQLAVNIDARIEGATNQKVEFDPAIPIKLIPVTQAGTAAGRVIRATGSINGGGETLYLRTVGGNIKLMYVDQGAVAVMDQAEQAKLAIELRAQEAQIRQHLRSELQAIAQAKREQELTATIKQQQETQQLTQSRIAELRARIEDLFSRPVRVDPVAAKARLRSYPLPVYPLEAKRLGIQGLVQLEVTISEEGKVEAIRRLTGHPLLMDAAAAAVSTWQYEPTVVSNRAVKVITRVDIEFRSN
jgi:TonB family protein